MNNLVSIISVIGFAITAAGLIGVSFRVGRNAQTVSNYRDSADAWESKARAQADELADMQAKLNEAQDTINAMKTRLVLLEELITGRTAASDLAADLKAVSASLHARFDELARQRPDVTELLWSLSRGKSWTNSSRESYGATGSRCASASGLRSWSL